MSDLVEIDSLEALVIIDNDVDVFSWPAPNTVDVWQPPPTRHGSAVASP